MLGGMVGTGRQDLGVEYGGALGQCLAVFWFQVNRVLVKC